MKVGTEISPPISPSSAPGTGCLPCQVRWLEVVLHRKLQLSRTRSYRRSLFGNVAKVSGIDIAERVAEVRAVEDVIRVCPEVDLLLVPDSEVFGYGCAVGLETWCTFRRWASGAEGPVAWLAVGTDSVIGSISKFI
jgi:hypothetical protein